MIINYESMWKRLRSKGYNFDLHRITGHFFRWGQTLEEDPKWSPFGPEILDMEISSGGDCLGNCSFCSPSGSLINTPHGTVPIESLKQGDFVIGYDIQNNTPKIQQIEEIFEREYDGELVCIELTDGSVIELTPDHPVVLMGGKEVPAGDLSENDIEKIIFF